MRGLRGLQGQGLHGPRAQVQGDQGGGPQGDGLPRGRPRPGGALPAGDRRRQQGDHHPPRPGGRRHLVPARGEGLQVPRPARKRAVGGLRRPRGRGGRLQPHQHRRGQRHQAGHRAGRTDGAPLGHERHPWAAQLLQGRGDGLPGARNRPAPRLFGCHGPEDRRRDQPADQGLLRARPQRAAGEPGHPAQAGRRSCSKKKPSWARSWTNSSCRMRPGIQLPSKKIEDDEEPPPRQPRSPPQEEPKPERCPDARPGRPTGSTGADMSSNWAAGPASWGS